MHKKAMDDIGSAYPATAIAKRSGRARLSPAPHAILNCLAIHGKSCRCRAGCAFDARGVGIEFPFV